MAGNTKEEQTEKLHITKSEGEVGKLYRHGRSARRCCTSALQAKSWYNNTTSYTHTQTRDNHHANGRPNSHTKAYTTNTLQMHKRQGTLGNVCQIHKGLVRKGCRWGLRHSQAQEWATLFHMCVGGKQMFFQGPREREKGEDGRPCLWGTTKARKEANTGHKQEQRDNPGQ